MSKVRQLRPAPAPTSTGVVCQNVGEPRTAFGFSPWPAELVGLGAKTVGPYTRCEDCGKGTWVRYSGRACCLWCAIWRQGDGT